MILYIHRVQKKMEPLYFFASNFANC